ncbi:transposase [Psychrobacter sp. DAB_AL32B]|uniref:transposase n=1 Tax=Psychrobacter sp. DAB_AL32B TaxID=1028414 RepID=UPI000B9D322A|nr:transposase [Psychrobacter sp. DAB_AL32B]OXL21546.1 transposase [Psychrobacter sp. DAB_AL32B]
MDESGFEHATIRPHGYAPIGTPCIDSYNWQGKKRTNVIGALYEKTLFALDCIKTNINGDIFYHWCKHTLIPSLKRKCVIVMDMSEDKAKHCFARAQGESCARVISYHKRVKRLLNRHGHRLLFLPPYSPDLNPIEKKWAQVKFLRQGWMENDLSKLFYDISPSYNTFILN